MSILNFRVFGKIFLWQFVFVIERIHLTELCLPKKSAIGQFCRNNETFISPLSDDKTVLEWKDFNILYVKNQC